MAIRKQLGPWQEQLIKILIRRWGARHGGIWPDARRARYARNQIRAVVLRYMYGGRAVPWRCNTPSRASEIERESHARRHCLKLLRQEADGQWEADAHILAVRTAGMWKNYNYNNVEVRHAAEAVIRAKAQAERGPRYYVLPNRHSDQR